MFHTCDEYCRKIFRNYIWFKPLYNCTGSKTNVLLDSNGLPLLTKVPATLDAGGSNS